jgi:hypothetical protein
MITQKQVSDLGDLRHVGVELPSGSDQFRALQSACQGPFNASGVALDRAAPIYKGGATLVGLAVPIAWHPGGPSASRMDPKDPTKQLEIKPYSDVHLYLPAAVIDEKIDWVLTDTGINVAEKPKTDAATKVQPPHVPPAAPVET